MTREEAIDVYNGLINTKIKEAFEFFAPELHEINEEEIRKDIIGGLMWQRDNLKSEGPHDNNLILPGFCLAVGKHLTYLEKQKDLDKMIVVSPDVWDNAITDAYENGKKDGEKQKEQKPCEPKNWPADKDNLTQEQKPELVQQPPITYTYNSNASRDERLKAALLALLNSDLLKVKEGGYFTKKDLIEWVERIPTDKEWSEEDERKIVELKTFIAECNGFNKSNRQKAFEIIDSLRPSWKPSEEQMDALEYFIRSWGESGTMSPQNTILCAAKSLFSDLQKLL